MTFDALLLTQEQKKHLANICRFYRRKAPPAIVEQDKLCDWIIEFCTEDDMRWNERPRLPGDA